MREYNWKNAQPCRFPDVSVTREDLLGAQYKQQHLVLGDASCQLAVKSFLCDARRYAVWAGLLQALSRKTCFFGEPIFAYVNVAHKGNAKWQRVIMFGKAECQDTFVVLKGSGVMLTKSVRRIQCDWKSHLGFYIHFNAPTWQFKPGFGGRIIPTKRTVEPISQAAQPPVGPVLPSML